MPPVAPSVARSGSWREPPPTEPDGSIEEPRAIAQPAGRTRPSDPSMSLWNRFRDGLTRTRETLGRGLGATLGLRGPVDPETRQGLEDALIAADVGPATAERLIERAEQRMNRESLDLREALEREAATILGAHLRPF